MKYKILLWMVVILMLSFNALAIDVNNCSDLMNINTTLNGDYTLTQNIDCSSTSVSPIGSATVPFSGTIDGAGYTISNLDYGNGVAGFFGGYNVSAYNEVYNITFDNATVNASVATVGLIINEPTANAFMNHITIINSQITGTQNAQGLILGDNRNVDSSIDFNINLKNIIINDSTVNGGSRLSAVVGRTRAGNHSLEKIDVNNVNITSSNQLNGGIIGDCAIGSCSITNASFNGRIVGSGQAQGGIVGQFQGSASDSITIKDAYAKGYIEGTTRVGGILGYFSGSSGIGNIDNVYTAVILNSTSGTEGGGINARTLAGNTINIDNSFAINGETQTVTQNGGMIGTSTGTHTVSNFVWQNTTTTADSCVGFPANNTNCTVQDTTSYYYNSSNAPMSSPSWDFVNTWAEQTSNTPCLQFEQECAIPSLNHSSPKTVEILQGAAATISSASYTTVISTNIEVEANTDLTLKVVGDIEGSGANTEANCRITFNATEQQQKTISPANNQHKSFNLKSPPIYVGTKANYTTVLECKRDGSNNFEIANSRIVATDLVDQNNLEINHAYTQRNTTLSSSSYALLDTYTYTSGAYQPQSGYVKDAIQKMQIELGYTSTGTTCFIIDTNGLNSSEYCRYGEASSVGSGSYYHIVENLTLSESFTTKLYGKSTTSDGNITFSDLTFDWYGHAEELEEISFINTSFTSSSFTTLASETVVVDADHTSVALVSFASLSVKTTSGNADMSFRIIINNTNGTQIDRDVTAANQNGLVTIIDEFVNVTTGTYTVSIQALTDNVNSVIDSGELITYITNEVLTSNAPTYRVYAYRQDTLAALSNFTVTTQSDGTVYNSINGYAQIPITVSSENITTNKTGYTANVTLNHNTATDLNASLVFIAQAPTLNITFSPSATSSFGTQTTATGNGCPSGLSCNLYRNSVLVSNPDTQNLSAGVYTYVFNTTGNINYSAASVSSVLTVQSPNNPVCTRLSDYKVPYNTSYTYNSECSSFDGSDLDNITISCDNGDLLTVSSIGANNYSLTNATSNILVNTECTITVFDNTGLSSIYTHILDPAQGGELIVGVCPTEDQGFTMLWILVAIAGFLCVIAMLSNIPIIYILSGVMTITLGWYVAGCVMIAYVILLMLGILQLLKGLLEIAIKR